MVSLYPNPRAQDCYKVVNPIKMGYFPGGFNSLSSSTDAAATISTNADNSSMIYGSEDPNNKIVRKPYTITKCRETWTDQEHDKFIKALHLFDRDWKKIEAFIGLKTVIQIRSHAQKYFLKVQKNGSSEHVPPPPPRPKSSSSISTKSPKKWLVFCLYVSSLYFVRILQSMKKLTLINWSASAVSQVTGAFQYSAALPEFVITPNSFSVPINTVRSSAMSSWTNSTVPLVNASQFKVIPDFAQVYSFIASVLDSNASDHLRRLKMMDPINVETVLILMKNLAVNLTSPEFENHRRLISSYAAIPSV